MGEFGNDLVQAGESELNQQLGDNSNNNQKSNAGGNQGGQDSAGEQFVERGLGQFEQKEGLPDNAQFNKEITEQGDQFAQREEKQW
ncbi:hypothetical protein L228DRAFT_284984 [Xylona heveae TC161]|uniref:Uncharacterized protein n=1 Tax=Xylona heveae (strain CBS 132557 / TC161) TaxID=1328760 RepID=A0A165ACM7_XYLHT|nr:hypothetical protein L228DRAFT_284984 [Xylona heveae TC161]KZF20258.1 hypothetical protein L228DRAFT_284984 [Xylona heveae TC161]